MGGVGSGRFGHRGGRLASDAPCVRRINSRQEITLLARRSSTRSPALGRVTTVHHCPACDRNIRILFELPGGHVGCRTCLRLTYTSRRMAPARRLHRTAARVLAQHGIVERDNVCERPRYMHWTTFHRVMDRVQSLTAKANRAEGLPTWLTQLVAVPIDADSARKADAVPALISKQ